MMSGVTSLEARLPGSSPNTLYQLRGRSGSDRDGIGEGMDSVSTGDFMAYPEGMCVWVAFASIRTCIYTVDPRISKPRSTVLSKRRVSLKLGKDH